MISQRPTIQNTVRSTPEKGVPKGVPQLEAQSVTQTGWLTTGEAYERLTKKGFDRAINTFRRWLADAIREGELQPALTDWGLEANFELRRAANPKDNSVRWLRFK